MKVVAFIGGLGNQMFQYVFYNYLKENSKEEVLGYYGKKELGEHYGLELTRVFEPIDLPKQTFFAKFRILIYKVSNRFLSNKRTSENDEGQNGVYYGYWHDLKYFSANTPNLFSFKTKLTGKNADIKKKIQKTESVSVHIRRGDYINFNSVYGNICTPEYYQKALAHLKSQKSNPVFYFFSDDMAWVKENFPIDGAEYIDWNTGNDSHLDLYLMSLCKNNIIANSTFSWWGAYLNKNLDKIVVAPSKWINMEDHSYHIFPKTWYRI